MSAASRAFQARKQDIAALGRTMIVASALHPDGAIFTFPIDARQARLLGRGFEALAEHEAQVAACEALHGEAIGMVADASARLTEVRHIYRRAIILNVNAAIWSIALLLAGWLA